MNPTSPNFLKKNGQRALVKCPECHSENYALNVLSGICTWCGFDINSQSNVDNKEAVS